MTEFIGIISYILTMFWSGGMTVNEQHVAMATVIAVEEHGGDMDDVATLLTIGWCESGLDPNAVNRSSGATGVWQHIENRHWGWSYRMERLGLPADTSRSDVMASARASAWLLLVDEPGHGLRNWSESFDGDSCRNMRQHDIPRWMIELRRK